MRTLYTVACPELDDVARRFIERVRAAHDPQHGIVDAHFTLLFGSAVADEAAYAAHVRAVAGRTGPIRFACHRAVTHTGAIGQPAHVGLVYLVPDEGSDAIAQLHDRLYAGPMAGERRTGLAYQPHITVAARADAGAAEALCDSLNAAGVHIAGRLAALQIGTLQDGRFRTLWQHALAPA